MKAIQSHLGTNKNLQLIQLLRAIACLLVVFYHATGLYPTSSGGHFLFGFFSFGYAGVDVFFVLSGFIITYTSLKYLGKVSHTGTFLFKRFVRIYPTYWIITICFLAFQIIFPSFYRTYYQFNGENIIYTFLLLPGHTMVNGVSWTLTNELYFYLLFVTVFFAKNMKLLFILIMLYCLIIVGNYFFVSIGILKTNHNSLLDVMLQPMTLEFFMGVFAAFLYRKLSFKFVRILIVLGLVLFGLGAFQSDNLPFSADFSRVICYGIPSFLIVTAVAAFEFKKIFSLNKVWLALGDASYSLYLIHLPILAAVSKIISKLQITNIILTHSLLLLSILILCLIAYLFYKYVESPIIKSLIPYRRKGSLKNYKPI